MSPIYIYNMSPCSRARIHARREGRWQPRLRVRFSPHISTASATGDTGEEGREGLQWIGSRGNLGVGEKGHVGVGGVDAGQGRGRRVGKVGKACSDSV